MISNFKSRIGELFFYFTIITSLSLCIAFVTADAADALSGLPDKAIGYGKDVTGGKGGETVRVTNVSEFENAANSEDPMIIEIVGVIETGNRDVKSNKTIIGVAPGATLI